MTHSLRIPFVPLSDTQWEAIAAFLPKRSRGRPCDVRACLLPANPILSEFIRRQPPRRITAIMGRKRIPAINQEIWI
jgi:hypothetical protein